MPNPAIHTGMEIIRSPLRSFGLILLMTAGLQAADLASLAHRLISVDNRQRETATAEATALSPDDKQQLARRLTPLLKGTDTDQREHAAEALGALGAAAEPAIPVLQANLSDDFPYVRIHSAEALSHIGAAAIPAFIEALKNDNNEVRMVAAQALAHLGAEAKPAIPALVLALDDKEGQVRQRAANALENCGADAAPPLMEALANPSYNNRIGLVRVLGAIDGTPPHLPAQLTPLLSDPDSTLRMATIKALVHKGQSAVSAVSQSLGSDNALVRTESADILADIGPDAALAVPLLISNLKDADAHVRAASAHALGKMHDAASPAIPSLRETLKDPDRDVAARAQEALTAVTVTFGGSTEPKAAYTPGSEEAPKAPVAKPKPMAKPKPKANTSSHAGKKPSARVKSSEPSIQPSYLKLDSTASIHALEMTARKGTIQTHAVALNVLGSMLQDPDDKIRVAAAAALERVDTDESKKMLEPYKKQEQLKKINRLMGEIQTSTGSVKEAMDELVAIGPPAVPAASKALSDSKSTVRLTAADILTRIGPAASPAVPRLINLLNDNDEAMRRQAAKALEVMNKPEAKNPLRIYYIKEKLRPYLKIAHITI